MVFWVLGHFGKTAESNPKSATPTFHINWVLNQVSYTSFSLFGGLGQFAKTKRGRPNYPKLFEGILIKYSKFFNLIFDLVSNAVLLTQLKSSHHIRVEMFIIARQVKQRGSYMLYPASWCLGVFGLIIVQLGETQPKFPNLCGLEYTNRK